jgi:uncharacterized Zn-finger protein
MQLSKTVETLMEAQQWQTAGEYGEPGYGTVNTTMVVLGNYWCNCNKIANLHEHANHHPRIWAQMKTQGIEFEWHDEWVVDYAYNKAYRCEADSYQWQPSYIMTDDGKLMTAANDIDTWTEWAANDAERAIPSRIINKQQLVDAGWMVIHDRIENGWHQGMDDDPKAYLDMEQDNMEKAGVKFDYLFTLDETSQFYITFSMWAKPQEGE